MNARPSILLDGRQTEEIVRDLLSRRLGFVPEWQVVDGSPDSALARILARYLYAIIKRLNQAPEKNKLAFLDLLGLALVPAQAARVPIVFEMSADAGDGRAPAGTQLAAPPPPESSEQIVFETERATGLGAAKLSQVVSLWPGRDQYLDHTAPLLAGESVQLFRKPALIDTPHELYLAHEKLLALAGSVTVEVEFELIQPSSE
ncbi:MAG TPA: putative baseplate assembly protein, partial [Blastocatellia bacterium]|nr:putative baseplate assembly protein [Blastocatellia bacterium]